MSESDPTISEAEFSDEQYRQEAERRIDEMYRAAREGDLETVKYLVTGLELEIGDGWYLLEAAEHDQPRVVRYLIKQGADVNIQDGWILCYAAGYGYLSIVKLLISHGLDIASYGKSGMECAITEGQLEVVKYLHSLGIRSCPDANLHLAAQNGYGDVIEFLLSQGDCNDIRESTKESVLEHAIRDGYANIIALLLSRGMVLSNNKYYQSMRDAVERGHLDTVRVLWRDDKGIEGRIQRERMLEDAIEYGRFNIVRFLIPGKVNPDIDRLTAAIVYNRDVIADYIYDEIHGSIPRSREVENGKTRKFVAENRRAARTIEAEMGTVRVLSRLIGQYY